METNIACGILKEFSDIDCYVDRYNIDERRSVIHMHEYIQINYVVSGEAIHCINDKECVVKGGDVFVIPPMVEHRILKKDCSDAEIFEFEFTPEFIFNNNNRYDINATEDVILDFAYVRPFLVKKEEVKPSFSLSFPTRRRIESLLEIAFDEFRYRKSSFEAMLSALISQVLIIIGREYALAVANDECSKLFKTQKENILNAIEYVNKNFTENLTVDAISAKFYISTSYFKRLFKYFTSYSFVEYVTELRIKKALELLEKTEDTITNVALNAGFNSTNHFNRVFKAKIKVSPQQYRRQIKI